MDKSRDLTKLISKFKLDCSVEINNSEKRKFHHGYEYVDLGLPSGTLWATCNVGAEKETDFGNHYKFGMDSKTYSDSDIPPNINTKELPSSLDTATQVWGGGWHMPTKEQVQELISKTFYNWIYNYKDSGISGGLFTAWNGNSVFFPACGYKYGGHYYCKNRFSLYWTSSVHYYCNEGYYLYLSDKGFVTNFASFHNGFTVRPVIGFGC